VKGYIGHTDHSWWQYLRGRSDLQEVNFWRPSGARRFSALASGEPFFFRLKSPINRIGGFGLFARYAALPIWRTWEVFGQANGVADELQLLERVSRLARRRVGLADAVGCVAVTGCTFFDPDDLVDVPRSFNPQNLSGALIDLGSNEGQGLWAACLERAVQRSRAVDWIAAAVERQRHGQPHIVTPRLGQGSFRIAVMDAYRGACAITREHSLPALEAVHIRPWSEGGSHELPNGLPLRRDLHRLFDLGYVSVRPDGRFLVSTRLKSEFANGHTYYALEGLQMLAPFDPSAKPSPEHLAWHSEAVFRP
jgi:putative restriction endonuclease